MASAAWLALVSLIALCHHRLVEGVTEDPVISMNADPEDVKVNLDFYVMSRYGRGTRLTGLGMRISP